jgi:hypothetical protein
MNKPTKAQVDLLRWFVQAHNGQVEKLRLGRHEKTWRALARAGLVEVTGEGGFLDMNRLMIVNCWMSLSITDAGRAAIAR